MRSFFPPSTLPARRIITGLALLAYVASVVGYPLPLPAGGPQDTSTPFPCQGSACGCSSAEQCFESCCCHSPAERLAWIQRHKAQVPAATLAALRIAARAEQTASEGSCCQSKQAACAAKTAASAPAKSCCDHAAESSADEADSDVEAATVAIVWVNAIQAQKCQGLTTLWLISGANLPLEIRSLWNFDWKLLGSLELVDEQGAAPAHEPPVPPPWHVA